MSEQNVKAEFDIDAEYMKAYREMVNDLRSQLAAAQAEIKEHFEAFAEQNQRLSSAILKLAKAEQERDAAQSSYAEVLGAFRGAEQHIKDVESERDALKATIVATIGGTDDEGNPTSEINYLQRLRRLVAFERDGLEAMRQNAIFYSSLDSTEAENAKLKQERDAMAREVERLREGLKRLEWWGRSGLANYCIFCSGWQPGTDEEIVGHKPDCWLAGLLKGGEGMSAKGKGTRNEHKAMRILEAAGYSCTRAAASLGIFDIVAINGQGVRLVQCKTNRNAPPHEREAIREFKVPPGCTKEIWIWYDYRREPAITEVP